MASQPLNLYSSRVMAEHPLVIWPMDEKADFFALLSESKRTITVQNGWTILGGTSEQVQVNAGQPFPFSAITKVTTTDPSSVKIVSPVISSFSDLNKYLGTFTVSGGFLFDTSSVITTVELGIEYQDPSAGLIDILKPFSVFSQSNWIFVSETFDIPHDYDYDFRLVIKVNYTTGGVFFLNGVNIGQWSEEFNATSLGVDLVNIPANIHGIPSTTKGIRIYGAGEDDQDGFFLSENNKINARNVGLPIAYGSSHSTFIEHSSNGYPSIILPANDFLMNEGRYRTYTLEFWAKINSNSVEKHRIVGPISSADGIYVHGPFIKLQIGKEVSSYSVSEWGRPMLIHMVYDETSAYLLINGEMVCRVDIDRDTIALQSRTINGNNANWIGFYGSELVEPFEVDTVSIYTYAVSPVIAKRRFVYGQAVQLPESLKTAYEGTLINIDYQYSDYSANYSYPADGAWSKARLNNIEADQNKISAPKYSLPRVEMSLNSESQWLEALNNVQNDLSGFFITMKPNQSWNESGTFLSFDRINITKEPVKAFYQTLKLTGDHNQETLFVIEDASFGDKFEAKIVNDKIEYSITASRQKTVIATADLPPIGEVFAVGVDFDKISSYYGGQIRYLFSKTPALSLYVAGSKTSKTFTGKIFKVGLVNATNLYEVKDAFASNGIVWYKNGTTYGVLDGGQITEVISKIVDSGQALYSLSFIDYLYDGGFPDTFANALLINNIASYTLGLYKEADSSKLDVATKSSWSDYIPLSYFARYITDVYGDKKYDLDYLQFNIGYPAPSVFYKEEKSGDLSDWDYAKLQDSYRTPYQKTYSDLDNGLYTGYRDYESLRLNTQYDYKYNTDNSLVKTFIYFRYIDDSVGSESTYHNKYVSASKNGLVNPGSEWVDTRYEVVDNMVIYPPSGVDLSKIAICIDIQLVVDGVAGNPIKIDRLQLASQAINDSYGKAIGTRYGEKIYPYIKNGFYYSYKDVNPVSISKQSNPYLYLNNNFGLQVLGDFDPRQERGVYIPINKNKSTNFKVIALQTFARFGYDFFPYAPQEVFAIESNQTHIKFYVQSAHPEGKRGRIFAVNQKTGQVENGIAFFLNGRLVREPVLTAKQWAAIGISFANFIDFSGHTGSFRVIGPLAVNNISYYGASKLQQVQNTTNRQWIRVKNIGGTTETDWDFWTPFIWNEVLVLSRRTFYGISPEDIYKTYTGTQTIIIDDDQKVKAGLYQYRVISGANKSNLVITPL